MSKLNAIHPAIKDFAIKAMANGMTVYAARSPQPRWDDPSLPVPLTFFHYSREIEGQTYYGTVQAGDFPALGQSAIVIMPRQPSREWGSGVVISEACTLQAMEKAARPMNGGLYTRDQMHRNAKPWGVPDVYDPVVVSE